MQVQVNKILGLNVPDSVMMEVKNPDDWASEVKVNIPAKNEKYLFRRELLRDLLAWHGKMKGPLFLHGPTQCGKTTLALQMANRVNVPVWTMTGHRQLELTELFGQFGLNESGGFVWMDGPLTQAAKNGGWFILNEVDRLRPDVLVGLNDVLEMHDFTLSHKQGEVVKVHPDFRIICTGNTNLAGDESGGYNTANIHDKSVLERFDLILAVDYMSADEEAILLHQVFEDVVDDELKMYFSDENLKVQSADGASVLQGEFIDRESFIRGLLRVCGMIRQQSADAAGAVANTLERSMSTTSLLRWASHIVTFRKATAYDISPMHYAMERALTNGCTSSTKAVIHELVKSVFGVEHHDDKK